MVVGDFGLLILAIVFIGPAFIAFGLIRYPVDDAFRLRRARGLHGRLVDVRYGRALRTDRRGNAHYRRPWIVGDRDCRPPPAIAAGG